jgi:hypothetical protein
MKGRTNVFERLSERRPCAFEGADVSFALVAVASNAVHFEVLKSEHGKEERSVSKEGKEGDGIRTAELLRERGCARPTRWQGREKNWSVESRKRKQEKRENAPPSFPPSPPQQPTAP